MKKLIKIIIGSEAKYIVPKIVNLYPKDLIFSLAFYKVDFSPYMKYIKSPILIVIIRYPGKPSY